MVITEPVATCRSVVASSHYTPKSRENEVRERIPVPHDNYFQSFFSSRHAARVISEFCSHDRAVWFHVGHQGISYHSSLCALRGRGM